MNEIKFYSPVFIESKANSKTNESYTDYFYNIKDLLYKFNYGAKYERLCNNSFLYYLNDEVLEEKILLAKIDVTIIRRNDIKALATVCYVQLLDDLSKKETVNLKNYIKMQFEHGYGVFVAEEVLHINNGEEKNNVKIKLYDDSNFYVKTESELNNDGFYDILAIHKNEVVEYDEGLSIDM